MKSRYLGRLKWWLTVLGAKIRGLWHRETESCHTVPMFKPGDMMNVDLGDGPDWCVVTKVDSTTMKVEGIEEV